MRLTTSSFKSSLGTSALPVPAAAATSAVMHGDNSIILEEEIDPHYIPTPEEVLEYAKWLGMDIEADKVRKEGGKGRGVMIR